MNRNISTYLDAVRFIAALAVFLCHIGKWSFGGFLWQMVPFGTPAVIVFFVLSGFVIAYVTEEREATVTEYIIARAARLYSVVLPVLALGCVIDLAGAQVAPNLYAQMNVWLPHQPWQGLIYLTFLNEAWDAHFVPGSMGAYWSLGYEVSYYALFAAAHFARGWRRVAGCATIAIIAGPRIMALFPIWLLGTAAYHISRRCTFPRIVAWFCFLGSFAAVVGMQRSGVSILAYDNAMDDHRPIEVAQDYLLGILFAANLIGFCGISDLFLRLFDPIRGAVRRIAGATFTLYLLHQPLIAFVRAIVPPGSQWASSWIGQAMIVFTPLVIAFSVAEVTERRKEFWRRIIASGGGRLVCLYRSWHHVLAGPRSH